jgi:hypothetical protein
MMTRTPLFLLIAVCSATVFDFELDCGAVPNDSSLEAEWLNGGAMNATLKMLQPGDELRIPSNETFFLMGGIEAYGLVNVTLRFDGRIVFSDDLQQWPRDASGAPKEIFYFHDCEGLTLTSSAPYTPPLLGDAYRPPAPPASGVGVIDGNGPRWWRFPGIGYLVRGEARPRLLHLIRCNRTLIEHLYLKDSPFWTVWADASDGLEIRYSTVDAARSNVETHDLIDMTAFNTDGFDVAGRNVWIHDVEVWNQDDCVAVKDRSEDMLIERVTASGVGLTIGSIGNSAVRNITFRDCVMHNTYKGIYIKFRGGSEGTISDVVYENIEIVKPTQWPIWIGPAQQSDGSPLCRSHCSICWPNTKNSQCLGVTGATFSNILLRNITITNPRESPGVLIADPAAPMQGVTFEDVVFVNPPPDGAWGADYYYCEGAPGVATGSTWPVPPCFEDQTDAALMARAPGS